MSGMTRWYALYVKHQHEKRVQGYLQDRGYEAWLPLFRTRRRWTRVVREIELPLFPHYVFCRFEAAAKLPILQTPAVKAIVGSREPTPIEDFEINSLKAVVGSGLNPTPHPFLQIGQIVHVTSGPLAGTRGILERTVKGSHRLVLSVSLLHRAVAVEIDTEYVMPVPDRCNAHTAQTSVRDR